MSNHFKWTEFYSFTNQNLNKSCQFRKVTPCYESQKTVIFVQNNDSQSPKKNKRQNLSIRSRRKAPGYVHYLCK